MNKTHYIPKGYNNVTPYLVIKGAAKAIEYYKNVFGATVAVRMDGPDGQRQSFRKSGRGGSENPETGRRPVLWRPFWFSPGPIRTLLGHRDAQGRCVAARDGQTRQTGNAGRMRTVFGC